MTITHYKYTTLVLAFIIVLTYTWHWESIFGFGKQTTSKNQRSGAQMMHRMPDGSMMSSDGSSVDMGSMMMDMSMNLKGKQGKDLEETFLRDMIPHHQGAVDMAKILLADPSVRGELRAFAEGIITAQEGEMAQMRKWVEGY